MALLTEVYPFTLGSTGNRSLNSENLGPGKHSSVDLRTADSPRDLDLDRGWGGSDLGGHVVLVNALQSLLESHLSAHGSGGGNPQKARRFFGGRQPARRPEIGHLEAEPRRRKLLRPGRGQGRDLALEVLPGLDRVQPEEERRQLRDESPGQILSLATGWFYFGPRLQVLYK